MADSLKASPAGLHRIDQARRSKRWHKTAEAWCAAAFTSRATLNRFWGGKPIRRETFVAICDAVNVDWQTVVEAADALGGDPAVLTAPPAPTSEPHTQARVDWGDAPDTAGFVGRETELQTLATWLHDDGCRLIVVLGMGGIGKTALSLYAARSQAEAFDCVLWRSLRNAPTAETVIQDCIAALLPEAVSQLPTHMDGLVNWLLKALRTRRCLLLLDNVESVLREGSRTGNYRSGYEGYGQLLRSLSETRHPSQVLITSRELPRGLTAREGRNLPVRCLRLPGLAASQSQAIFHHKGTFAGTAADWQALTERYAGNPLALKIVASAIRDFFAGDLAQFLAVVQQEALILDDIRDLIARQFERLPALEQVVMRWLAIHREPVTLAELQGDCLDPPMMRELLQAIATLQQRSLIEKQGDTFTQQPVVMEAVISDLIDGVCQALTGGAGEEGRSLLHDYALSQATAQDYVRNSQIHLIIQPILQQLGPAARVESRLKAQLAELRAASPEMASPQPSYAPGNLLTLLQALRADLTDSNFSGLPIYQVNLQNYPLHQTTFERCEFRRTVFTENLGNVLAVVFSPVSAPHQQRLATCDTDCTVRLWDALSGKLLRIFAGHRNWVRTVAFSPDGAVLASAGADHTLRLWEVESGACLRICQGHENEIFAVAFSPNGQWLVTGSSDRTLRLWDSFSGDCLRVYAGHESGVRAVAFCPASITLVSGSDDGTVRVWDVHSGQALCTMQAHSGGVRAVAIAPDETPDTLVIASGGGDHQIKLWNGYTGQLSQTLKGHSDTVYAIAFAPSLDMPHPWQLASGSGDCTIRLWQRDPEQCLKTLVGPQNQVSAIAIAPTGDRLAAVSLDQTVRLWHLPAGQITRTWTSHTDWVFPVAFSPDGASLVSGSNDGSVRVWSVSQHICRQTLLGHRDQVCALAVCPENHLIASASRDATIRLWDWQTGQCCGILRGHRDWVYTVAFSSTRKAPSGWPLLASGGADGQIRLWDCQTGACLQTLSGHQGQVWDVAFSQTGLLASGGADHTARIWDVETATCLQVLTGHENRVYSVAFPPVDPTTGEPTDAMLLTSSSDQTIKTWEWRSRTCRHTYHQHTNWVFDIACAPDGTTFASASHDQTLRIWDAATHTCRHCCSGHDHLVSSVAYSPDGRLIASGSQDQSVRLWDSQTGACSAILRAPRLYEGMKLTHCTGLTTAQLATLTALGAIA